MQYTPRLKREAATYIILRKKGYSINLLSKIFGRSTSMIHRILKKVGLTGATISGFGLVRYKLWNPMDMRKSRVYRNFNLQFLSHKMMQLFQKWLSFMDGEGEKPP